MTSTKPAGPMHCPSHHAWLRSWHVTEASIIRGREWSDPQIWSLELWKPFCFISEDCMWVRRLYREQKGWESHSKPEIQTDCILIKPCLETTLFLGLSLEQSRHFLITLVTLCCFLLLETKTILIHPYSCMAEWIRSFDYKKYVLVFRFEDKCLWSIALQGK